MAKLGPSFGRLWAASAVSNLGDGIAGVAFPLLVASITRDPVAVSLATFAGALPWFVFALVAGALSDRMDRRKAMAITDIVRAVIIGGFGLTVLFGDASLVAVYVTAFLLGSAQTIFDTSAEAMIPALVDDDQLPAANGRLQATEWVGGNLIGPPIGAVLFGITASLPFLIDSVSFFAAALLIALVAGNHRPQAAPSGTIRSSIAEGVSWLWSHRVLRTLSLMAGLTNFVSMGIIGVFVLFAQDIVGVSNFGYGILISILGIGGLVGAMASGWTVRTFGPGTTVQGVTVGSGLLAIAVGLSSNRFVVGGLIFGFGFVVTHWNVVAVSLRQSLVPDELRGRVAAVARLLAWGTQPLGALLGGVVATVFSLRAPFFVAAVAWLLTTGVTLHIINNRSIAELKESAA